MNLLDTPQWESLTTSQKRIVGRVYGSAGERRVALGRGVRKVIENLEARGLIEVTWRERDVTIRLCEEGWTT